MQTKEPDARVNVFSFCHFLWGASYLTQWGLALFVLIGCICVALFLHEPVPRVHDEFSYLLMSDTFARGRVANPAPPVPEFFDTFHVLVRPVHVSKYFPCQGMFLAIGEGLAGHPAVGVWLSSALACAATMWMLSSWLNPAWGLAGGLVMALRFGIFSYWSQSYWGGMVAALGGALFLGATRRLWDRFSWQNTVWLGFGIALLLSSRPLEGAIIGSLAGGFLLFRIWTTRRWQEPGFPVQFAVPLLLVLLPSIGALAAYNRAITGSVWKTPYMLHESQYQESPPFLFQSQKSRITYSSVELTNYYEKWELRAYRRARRPWFWPQAVGERISTWWGFYCGVLLTAPLVIPALLRKGKLRVLQAGVIAAMATLPFIESMHPTAWKLTIDLIAALQAGILWQIFRDTWSRLALLSSGVLLFVLFFTKWLFPHYFAPAASLILYLQLSGLRQIWEWKPSENHVAEGLSRTERRRMAREKKPKREFVPWLRAVVYLVPVACLISLVWSVEGRLNGRPDRSVLTRGTLLLNDWSLRRAELDHWLEQQPTRQLVFVRYSPYHPIFFEWVYNHADIMHSHVIWARDLGAEHNKLLLSLLPDRTVWLIEPDSNPQLVPYADAENLTQHRSVIRTGNISGQEGLDW